MGNEKEGKIDQSASVKGDPNAALTSQPTVSIQPNNSPKTEKANTTAIYQEDAWEAMPFDRKAAGIGFGAFILILIVLYGPHDVAMIVLTAAIALVGLNQYYIYKRQAYFMLEGLAKTQELIEQNEDIVSAVSSQAEYMKGQLMAMKAANKRTDKIIAQAERAAKQSERAFSVSVRPVMVINDASWIYKNYLGDETHSGPHIDLDIINTGNSVANNLYIRYLAKIFSQTEWSLFKTHNTVPTPTHDKDLGLVGAKLHTSVVAKPSNWSDGEWIDALKKKTARLYVWGQLIYRDTLGDSFVTSFCMYVEDISRKDLTYNSTYNDIGKMLRPDSPEYKKHLRKMFGVNDVNDDLPANPSE